MDNDQVPSAPRPKTAEQVTSYEPPSVKDLDGTYGPSVTAAGGTSVGAAPRKP